MSTQIEKKFEELSLLLVMTDHNDKAGLDIVKLQLNEAGQLLEASTEHPRLNKEYKIIKEQLSQLTSNPVIFDTINKFAALAQNYFRSPQSVAFSYEKDSKKESMDLGDFFDPEFLPEFIEKHNVLLQDFEGAILDCKFKRTSTPDSETTHAFEKFVRSYLHSIKGDAGSIGLVGIEKVTHYFEDIVADRTASAILDELIAYKEWVYLCLQCYTEGVPLAEDAATFTKRVKEMLKTAKVNSSNIEIPQPLPSIDAVSANTATTVVETTPTNMYTISPEVELLVEFIVEAEDHLNSVEALLLENTGEFPLADVDTLFRAVHSIKGASSYFNLIEINKTSHALENLLDEVRDGQRKMDEELKQLTLRYIDLQRKLMKSAKSVMQDERELTYDDTSREFLFQLFAYREQNKIVIDLASEEPANDYQKEVGPSETVELITENKEETIKQKEKLGIKSYVKVDTDRLDQLIEAIGEMVIYSSMLIQNARNLLGHNEVIIKTTHQVEKFSRDLQEIGMSMRLDPIKGLFQKMSRLVWDISKKLKKEVNITMSGEDTELDRTVIEKLADPLMHMVRNAVDHGIEPEIERIAKGKPAAGSVHLSASHSGGNIVISVVDDGKGLDADKLRKKAIEKGIITESTTLSQNEIYHLIFHPGFSTAEKVTDISGRGVGMDVVRNNIESMRGQVRIDSELGKGTTFTIELPLTLAIIEGIEVIVGSERFIIPTLSILEFMKATPEMLSSTVGKLENFLFREHFLPLYRISELYNIEPKAKEIIDGLVVVVESGREQIALFIDDIVGTCQTVIKSLGSMFEEGQGLSGCAIMPDGEIGLILDVRSLTQLARTNYVRGTVLASLTDKDLTIEKVAQLPIA